MPIRIRLDLLSIYIQFPYIRWDSNYYYSSFWQPSMHNRIQLTDQSLSLHSHINNQHSASMQPSIKKSTQRDQPATFKQNESKHMNAIKPYVSNLKQRQRKISKRDSQKNIPVGQPYQQQNSSIITNPYESNSKGKNKKEMSTRKNMDEPTSRNITDLYTELISLKAQYKALKNSYNDLQKEKNQLTQRGEQEAANNLALTQELDRARKEEQRSKNNIRFIEQEMERIKKQCVRMVEAEKFKNKKLEETLQQKQLMIAYLRSQLSLLNGQPTTNTGFFFQHTAPTYIKNQSINDISYKLIQTSGLQQAGKAQMLKNMNSSSKPKQLTYNNNDRSMINQSAISSIPNNSLTGHSELIIDLPRQLNVPKKKPISSLQMQPEANSGFAISGHRDSDGHQNKREYIFSNEDDSLIFSNEKSKEDLRQYDSIQSSDPTVLTFTKKDIYVFDQQADNDKYTGSFMKNKDDYSSSKGFFEQKENLPTNKLADKGHLKEPRHRHLDKNEPNSQSDYSDISDLNNNEDKSSYTGEQELMTFQNRYGKKDTNSDLIKLLNPIVKDKKKVSKSQHRLADKNKIKEKSKVESEHQKKQISSKSKLLTKRLQINTDEAGLGEGKESSAETRKLMEPSKTGKKKMNRKRRSEEGGSLIKR